MNDGRPCIKSEAYGVSAEVCGCPKCRVTLPQPVSERARELIAEWREGERNSPYGLDEHGTRIPMRDGNQCADELESALSERGAQRTESQGVDADAGFPPTPDPASGKQGG